ncbi:MAG TPA: hypothetical protein VMT52_16920 [Planctomycetota bacterium]|nr:hypothetical protein [Planctomycetota bacterium]
MTRVHFATGLSMLAAAVLGCERSSVSGPGDQKLTLHKPANQTIERGATNEVKIEIDRGNFRDAITVEFGQLPMGVRLNDQEKKVLPDAESATFTFFAEPTAELVKNHRVTVTAKGTPDLQVTETFELSVEDKG